jgi:hypothetical protein
MTHLEKRAIGTVKSLCFSMDMEKLFTIRPLKISGSLLTEVGILKKL